MDHFYEKIPGWFDFQDLYQEAVRIAPNGAVFVEVGCYLGRSLAFLLTELVNSGKEAIVVSVDACDRLPAHIPILACTNEESRKYAARKLHEVLCENLSPVVTTQSRVLWEHFEGKSVEIAHVLRMFGQRPFFVFIDADHSYQAVREDLRAWWPLVTPGGVLAGHDHQPDFPGVERAVREFRREVEWSRFEIMRASFWLGKPR